MLILAPNLEALPGVRHGFFTRQGGVSEGAYASLNAGLRSGDALSRVRENRARCAGRLGLDAARLRTARQVHGKAVALVRGPWPEDAPPEADALVSDRQGLLVGVLSADCAPVLLADAQAGVVAAVHAGWRGALAGVLEEAVAAMERLGAARPRIAAAVGPCIARDSYEVGPELQARFLAEDPGCAALLAPVPGSDRLLLDLRGYALRRLARVGIEAALALPHDTFADEERFFSYRRQSKRGEDGLGLQLSAIARVR